MSSLSDLFHAANNGERLGDTNNAENPPNQQGRNRDDDRNSQNEHEAVRSQPSIVPYDNSSRKERKIMSKSKSLTLPTLLRGNDLFFDTSIQLHRCILAAQLI